MNVLYVFVYNSFGNFGKYNNLCFLSSGIHVIDDFGKFCNFLSKYSSLIRCVSHLMRPILL